MSHGGGSRLHRRTEPLYNALILRWLALHPFIMSLLPAVATVSLGRATAGHSLPDKIMRAAAHSMQGIEIFYECLEQYAYDIAGVADERSLLQAAVETKGVCDRNSISIICLQPFMHFEGLTSEKARAAAFQRLKLWFKIAHALGTDLIQVPTNFQQEGTTGSLARITADLREAGLLGLQEEPVIRLAYEAVSWGTYIDVWEDAWEVVKLVDLPNVGLCIDTFHVAGRVYGDPAAVLGRRPTGEADLNASLCRMAEELDVHRIFYIQVGDAQKLSPPLDSDHPFYDIQQPKRMSWSRNARLFTFEHDKGGYLPVDKVLDALVRLGYRGWASMETFNHELYGLDPALPEHYATRAEQSWRRILQFLKKKDELEVHAPRRVNAIKI